MICKACYGLKIKWQILWKIPKSPWLSSTKAAVAVSSVVKQGRFWGWGCCVSVQNSGIRRFWGCCLFMYRAPGLREVLGLRLLCFSLQNPRKQGPDSQGSTAELITGLVQLVPQSSMPDIAQEAMEVRAQPGALRGDTAAATASPSQTVCVCAQHGFGQKCQGEPLGLQHECEVKTKMKCCGHRLTMNSCSSAENVFYIFWCS